MFWSYRYGRFNFNYYAVFNYQISYIFANHISFIPLYLTFKGACCLTYNPVSRNSNAREFSYAFSKKPYSSVLQTA